MNYVKLQQLIDSMNKQFGMIGDRFDVIDKQFEVIDKRFNTMEKRFDVMDKRFDDLEDQFASLYRYVEQRFGEFEKSLEGKADKAQLDRFIALLDKDLKERETDEQERLAISAQLQRHAKRLDLLEVKVA